MLSDVVQAAAEVSVKEFTSYKKKKVNCGEILNLIAGVKGNSGVKQVNISMIVNILVIKLGRPDLT